MRVRTPIAVGGAIVLIALLIAGAATLPSVGAQSATDDNSTITVGASGSVDAPPDLAVVDVAVEATADTAEGARGSVADNVASTRSALDGANVSDDQIRTVGFTIRPDRDENGTVTYTATHRFELRVPVDVAGSIVDTAVAGGATRVDGVRFTLADETARALRAEALESALSSARTDAEVIAGATGLEVGTVRSVETADGGIGPVFATAERTGTTFDPGPVTVTAHVTVTYAAG